jgi:hypothetical protein
VKTMHDGFEWLDDWLNSLSKFTIKLLILLGVSLWVAVAYVVVYNLFADHPTIEYTFHGHPIDVSELEEDAN